MQPVANPCAKDCPDRSPTCHSGCEKYANYAAWRESVRREKHLNAMVNQTVWDMIDRCRKRCARRNQQHAQRSE